MSAEDWSGPYTILDPHIGTPYYAGLKTYYGSLSGDIPRTELRARIGDYVAGQEVTAPAIEIAVPEPSGSTRIVAELLEPQRQLEAMQEQFNLIAEDIQPEQTSVYQPPIVAEPSGSTRIVAELLEPQRQLEAMQDLYEEVLTEPKYIETIQPPKRDYSAGIVTATAYTPIQPQETRETRRRGESWVSKNMIYLLMLPVGKAIFDSMRRKK